MYISNLPSSVSIYKYKNLSYNQKMLGDQFDSLLLFSLLPGCALSVWLTLPPFGEFPLEFLPVPLLIGSTGIKPSFIRFFCFIRLFWNQIFTCVSFSCNADAISIRLALVKYLLKWNSFSNSVSCLFVKFVRPVFRQFSPNIVEFSDAFPPKHELRWLTFVVSVGEEKSFKLGVGIFGAENKKYPLVLNS